MPLNFPSGATTGTIYTGTNSVVYVYDGIRWRINATGEVDPIYSTGTASAITATNISNWNTSYSWGNHATRGYLTATNTVNFSTKPISSTSTGAAGSLAVDGSYLYICTATNAWQRIGWDTNPW